MKHIAIVLAAGLGLTACAPAPHDTTTESAAAYQWLSIVDKTLVNGDIRVVLGSDGRVVGDGIEGTWEERDGKYCRTLTMPEQFAGTECQIVTLNGDEVTFDNQQGRVSIWTIE